MQSRGMDIIEISSNVLKVGCVRWIINVHATLPWVAHVLSFCVDVILSTKKMVVMANAGGGSPESFTDGFSQVRLTTLLQLLFTYV